MNLSSASARTRLRSSEGWKAKSPRDSARPLRYVRRVEDGKGGTEMRASALSFRTAVVFGLAGMAWGIFMAASRDHSSMPAHAHLNLLGWVSLFLFGIYYRMHPKADLSRLAVTQVGMWAVGTVILTIAVAAIHAGYDAADPIAAFASLTIVASMLLFAFIVFRPVASDQIAAGALAPAE